MQLSFPPSCGSPSGERTPFHRARSPLAGLAILVAFLIPAFGAEKEGVRKPPPSLEEIAKLPPDGGPEFNRLVFEKSPYLLQHCRNPVDWYPWGEEAFQQAKEENKPVFLSVGYSTCHWCHVMEHESFEDEEVAKLMNEYFICIKVDREERPDIDQIYMTITQAMTGSGGWPMTVIMTPDKKPFFAGTYFPKKGNDRTPGMLQLTKFMGEAWKKDPAQAIQVAEDNAKALKEMVTSNAGSRPTEETLDKAFGQLEASFDPRRGGFSSGGPRETKFPTPHNLSFLLRYWKRTGNPKALEMTEKTLTAMRLGGIYDHLGYGSHRYSTDGFWLLPHFEKMLYDQAQLVIANLEAHQATGKPIYARTAREILTYILRDMTSPEGAFYSAEDADSEGEEGKFYVWTRKEIDSVLGPEEGAFFADVFNVLEDGNFREEATGRRTGANVLHLSKPLAEIARDKEIDAPALRQRIDAARKKLFAVRKERIHPYKDDKILTDWNGLMIAAFARAGMVLGDEEYTRAARRAADFALDKLRMKNGRLWKRYRQGEAGLPAHLEDYAFLTWGLLEVYEATFDVAYLRQAADLTDITLKHFWDAEKGGFFMTADDGEELLARSKEIYDGALPSGNSVAALNLLRLGRITANKNYEAKAEALFEAFGGDIADAPVGHTQSLIAADFAIGPSNEIVFSGDPEDDDMKKMIAALRREFVPNKVVLLRPEGEEPPIVGIAEYTAAQKSMGKKATVYVCRNYACKLPTTKIPKMLENLGIPPRKLD